LKREEIIGKSVVATDAVVLGTARDIAVSLDGKAALQLDAKDGGTGDLFVSSDEIQALGDVVLLKHPSKLAQPVAAPAQMVSSAPMTPGPSAPVVSSAPPPPVFTAPSPSGRMCPRCAYTNSPTAKFCIKCGSPMT